MSEQAYTVIMWIVWSASVKTSPNWVPRLREISPKARKARILGIPHGMTHAEKKLQNKAEFVFRQIHISHREATLYLEIDHN